MDGVDLTYDDDDFLKSFNWMKKSFALTIGL